MTWSPTINDRKILAALDDIGGFTTACVARRCSAFAGTRPALRSAWIRSHLREMQRAGLVTTLDDEKPVCWKLTAAGMAERKKYDRL